MAPTDTSHVSLQDFIQQELDNLKNDTVQAEQLIAAAKQYSDLRLILEDPDVVRRISAALANPSNTAMRQEILELFTKLQEHLQQNTTEQQKAALRLPDQPLTQQVIREEANTLITLHNKIVFTMQQKRRTFIQDTVKNFARNNPDTIVRDLERNLEQLPLAPTESHIRGILNHYPTIPDVQTNIRTFTQAGAAQTTFAQTVAQQYTKVDITLLERVHATLTQEGRKEPAKEASIQALRATVLAATKTPEITNIYPVVQAANVTKGIDAIRRPIADVVFTVFPQGPLDWKKAIEEAWGDITSKKGLEKLTQKMGQEIVQSPIFQRALTAGSLSMGQAPSGSPVASGLGKLVDGIVSPLLRGPADEAMMAYMDFARQVATHPDAFKDTPNPFVKYLLHGPTTETPTPNITPSHFYYLLVFTHKPNDFSVNQHPDGHFAISLVTHVMRDLLSSLLRQGVQTGAQEIAGKGLTAFLTTALGIGTGGTSWIATIVGGKLIGGLLNFLGTFFGGASTKEGRKSFGILNALIIMLVGLVIMLPLLAAATSSSSFRAQMLQSGYGSAGTGDEPAPCDPSTDPTCPNPLDACDPTKQDCAWPTACGCINQGPNNGTGTHAHLNAIDVGVNNCGSHITVRATHDGYAIQTNTSFTDNQFQSGSYGNYVLLESANGLNTFQTIYAHLLTVAVSADPGRTHLIHKGDPLGTTDNNGNSFGEHLHYGYGKDIFGHQPAPDISTILPKPVPHCTFGQCGNICW